MGMKGLSPLIAVIMLIGFTMVVAGMLAIWTQSFARDQITNVRFCSEAAASIYPSTSFDSLSGNLNLLVYNSGSRDLEFIVFLTYQNGTVQRYASTVTAPSQDIATFPITGISGSLDQVTIQSTACPGIQDLWYA
jgi:flagellin-like protein